MEIIGTMPSLRAFFKTLKTEVVYQLEKQVEADNMHWIISEFIGHYNHDRPHSTNGYLSPNQFEVRNSVGTPL